MSTRSLAAAAPATEDDAPWHGCVCGLIHARPTPVFWIKCDGPCQAWYNVASKCVGGLTASQIRLDPNRGGLVVWHCRPCLTKHAWDRQAPGWRVFLQMIPTEIWFRILTFCEAPTHRAAVLLKQVAPVNKLTHQLIMSTLLEETTEIRDNVDDDAEQDKPSKESFSTPSLGGIWAMLLKYDYTMINMGVSRTRKAQRPQGPNSSQPSTASLKLGLLRRCPADSGRVTSKRREFETSPTSVVATRPKRTRRSYHNSSHHHPLVLLRELHMALLGRTEDAFYALEQAANPRGLDSSTATPPSHFQPLTVTRLRRILSQHSPLFLDRRSPSSGRTLLQVCCAADLDEGGIVACVNHLLAQSPESSDVRATIAGANVDPNAWSRQEAPFANRPVLYFAIARAMPRLVQRLLQAGAQTQGVRVKGRLRLTFDPDRSIRGSYSPLEYAQAIYQAEVVDASNRSGGGATDDAGSSQPSSSTPRRQSRVPPYWSQKLRQCIRILESEQRHRHQHQHQQSNLFSSPPQIQRHSRRPLRSSSSRLEPKRLFVE